MTATTWIGTPKALYRMARRGGDEWNRLKVSLPDDKREELTALNEKVESLAAELKDAKDAFQDEGTLRKERRLLREPWEEARQIALDPPESFELAVALVEVLHSEPNGKHRTKDLASQVHVDVNHDDFLEAIQLSVDAGFAEWTTSGKIRAVGVARLRASGMKFDSPDASLAKMCARLRVLHVAPMWMLHDNGSAESTPTEFQLVLNQMIPRLDGLKWAGPGIVADASVDLASLEAEEIWPDVVQKRRGTAEIEKDLGQAKDELKEALKIAAAELWAQRDPTYGPRAEVEESAPEPQPEPKTEHGRTCPNCAEQSKPGAVFCTHCGSRFPTARHCDSCGADREAAGSFCPDCGAKYDEERPAEVTELRDKRSDDSGSKPDPEASNEAADQPGRIRSGPLDQNALTVKHF